QDPDSGPGAPHAIPPAEAMAPVALIRSEFVTGHGIGSFRSEREAGGRVRRRADRAHGDAGPTAARGPPPGRSRRRASPRRRAGLWGRWAALPGSRDRAAGARRPERVDRDEWVPESEWTQPIRRGPVNSASRPPR